MIRLKGVTAQNTLSRSVPSVSDYPLNYRNLEEMMA